MNKITDRKHVLFIDTSSNERIIVSLESNGKKDEVVQEIDRRKSQALLGLIDALLKKHNVGMKDVTGIEVHTGPGSFTGLRVGVSIANTIGAVLNIPINENPPGVLVEPTYQ